MLENNAGSLLHTVLFGGCEYRDLSQWYSSVLKFALAMLTVLVPFFVDNLRRPIVAVSGAFVLMIGDDLTNSSKMFGILTFLIYYVLKESCLKMKRLKLNFQWTNKEVSSSIAVHRLVDPNEKRILKSDPELVVFDKTKLCTEFSDMNLGELCKSAPYTSEQCYLFKSSKMLIQPPKLRINYHESYDMQRESPTNSSGYESLVSFLKSTSDYISEFDSISNVDTSRSNDLLLSSYYRNSKAPHLIESKKCNKLSPRHLLDNSSYDLTNNMTNFHTKTSIPIYRIMLCSILCFTLGFLFQMVIAKFI